MKIAIIGSGAMGTGIAQVAAGAGESVYVFDQHKEALQRAEGNIQKSLDKLISKGKLNKEEKEAINSRIHFCEHLESVVETQLVIEAIVEDLQTKQTLFVELEKIVSKSCILASNTSSLSLASIASACRHPERVMGIHFFNPAPIMKLVEIIPALQTDKTITGDIKKRIASWGKVPVLAKDLPGFIVNRLARPFYGEALRILEEGIADAPTIDWAMRELGGFRMGPFQLMDFIGHDVNYKVTESVFTSFFYDPRYKPSLTQKRLVEAGYLGRKSDQGFYDYREGAQQPEPQQNQEAGKYILNRILAMLINEAVDALALKVASREDLELAMTKGVNYPKGLLAWADEWGLENVLAQLDSLYNDYHEDRYRSSSLLRKMVKDKQTFFTYEKV